VPRVTIPTGFIGPDGREEKLSEYLCDHPDCPNIAVHVLGVAPGLQLSFAVCPEHARSRTGDPPTKSRS
jgi:hypothetical protein